MGSENRRKKQLEIRCEDILDAAEQLFFSKGYENTSMNEIAEAAEFSKRTIYTYFSGKEQIYEEIMIRGFHCLRDQLSTRLSDHQMDAAGELRCLFFTFFDFSQSSPDYFQMIMDYETQNPAHFSGSEKETDQKCYEAGEEIFAFLLHAVSHGQAEGILTRETDTGRLAMILWAASVGIFSTGKKKEEYLKTYHHIDPETFISDAFQFLIHQFTQKDV